MLLLKAYITGSAADSGTDSGRGCGTDRHRAEPQPQPKQTSQARPGQARRGEASPTETHNLEPASRAGIRVYSGCVNAFGSDAVRAFD